MKAPTKAKIRHDLVTERNKRKWLELEVEQLTKSLDCCDTIIHSLSARVLEVKRSKSQ